ncbi:histidine ammonia-lyase [Egibacter rhizosphaerae]|uniref:Histidine ammonia-lyase n=1 Tax=Egibacter rhizosphaerae TaxID=1670831 RepID=A0A411YAV6_9ACTN|nr:aromatic amino acid lyase [Egibacter rhizosphaerae]QBI18309.1 histidine ammonia-lyase [Egibacter rhizosphaerae]
MGETPPGAREPLDGETLDPARVARIAAEGGRADLTRGARERNEQAARLADDLVSRGESLYGRNTGVGALLRERVEPVDAGDHSRRLLRSHAGGAGEVASIERARALMVVRANQLGAGGGGVSSSLHEAIVRALNAGVAPAVHRIGSIGTGDLTALAELGLALAGEGRWLGHAHPPEPVDIAPGDAIALMSSGAATLGEAALASDELKRLLAGAEITAGLTFTAARANPAALDPRVHAARPHPGQVAVARRLAELVGAAMPARSQDPVSLRSIPQVQGAARDAADELGRVLQVELNAAAENPLLDVEVGRALSNGNFHLARLALVLDQVRASLVQAAAQSVRRVAALCDERVTGLSAFLAGEDAPGSSGAMILEYTASAALEELRAAAAPATFAPPVLAHGQEDHASLAPQAARGLSRALEHYTTVVAVELVAAVRALRLASHRPASAAGERAYDAAASTLPTRMEDRDLSRDIAAAADHLTSGG